jgi:oligoendopeptidase F
MQKRLTRAEVPAELTWNLDDLYPSAEAWEAAYKEVEAGIPGVVQYKGRFGEGPKAVLACLDAQEALMIKFTQVATYANLRISEDGTNPANQAASARVAALGAKMGAALSFIRSEILALPEGTVERYLNEEPGLQEHKKDLEQLLEQKPHTLSPETEQTIAALGEVHGSPYMIYTRTKSSDISFDPIQSEDGQELQVSFALYEDHYEQSPDTAVRRKAWDSFTGGLKHYQNTLGATFATEVKRNVVMARLRGFSSTEEMLLQPQQVTLEAYNRQLDIIFKELAPHMQRYAKLRKRVLGLDKVMFCDLKAPLDPEYNPKTTFAQTSDLIIEALSVMGPEYTKVIQTALKERWVDLADNVGKSTGAFCSSPYGVHPFILITWTDTMRGAFVLAHELGHCGHFSLAQRNQRYVNTRPSMYFIEAPSTINELILGNHILSKSSDARMRRWVIMQFLGTYYHNFVTHLLEGELQRRIYKLAEAGTPVTASVLNQQKGAILQEFWGDTVEIDDGARLTWMRQPHYYMGLYPYTYSAGLTCGTTVAEAILNEGQPAVDRWLKVLKSGGTAKPMELMAMAGVDMTKPDPIRKAVAYVGSLVAELEKSF